MKQINARIERLEADRPPMPVKALFEAPGGLPGQYWLNAECKGDPVKPEELASLEKNYQLLIVEYRSVEKDAID